MQEALAVYEGRIATHDRQVFYGQIAINKRTGLIVDVFEGSLGHPVTRVFGNSCLIFPGMGDVHIHAREDETGKQNYKEEYKTAANAALNGGMVHVSAMPNTPNPLTTKKQFQWHRERIKKINHHVSILNYAGIGTDTFPIEEDIPYKLFLGPSVGTLFFKSKESVKDSLSRYKGKKVSFHVEDFDILEKYKNRRTHAERRPVECVETGLEYLLPIIEEFEIEAKLCHWSTGGKGFEMISKHRERAKKNGLPYTTVEVSPLHLIFDTSMTDEDPSLWLRMQMNPSIQNPKHRMELIKGLREGFIDDLATDHAPHTEEEKKAAFAKFKEDFPGLSNVEIAEAIKEKDYGLYLETCKENGTSGAPWLDTYSNVCVWLMENHKFTPQDIARVAAYNPGKFVNQFLKNQFPGVVFGEGFGIIEKDYVGSLTVLNTNKPQTIESNNLKTKVGWSPLEGMRFSGGLEAVIVRGEDVTGKFLN